jgi:DNA-binding MarR family transcriptional regulator
MERKPEPHDLLVAFLLVQSLLERRSDAFFQPFGITAAKFNILNLLARRQGRMDQAALVDLLLVGKSSVSIVINRMVREGLVKREEHPKDRRQTVLVLTNKGRIIWRKISPVYLARVNRIFGTFPVGRARGFLEELKILHDALKDDGDSGLFDRRMSNARSIKGKADHAD